MVNMFMELLDVLTSSITNTFRQCQNSAAVEKDFYSMPLTKNLLISCCPNMSFFAAAGS